MLYNIIKQLQEIPSTNDKLEIMKANKDNELFKEYMRLCTCPSVNFYITEKTFPVNSFEYCGGFGFMEITSETIRPWTKPFYNRDVTGNEAKVRIKTNMRNLTPQWQTLYKMLLLKDIRAKIGVTLVNKVWPNLCVDVPYQRCSLPDEKTLKKFNNGETFIVQTKGDGMFASLVLDATGWSNSASLFTRNGNKFPQWFAEYISEGLNDNQAVYEGELLCLRNGEILSRKEGNGILNSIMQGGEKSEDVSVEYYVWNRLLLEDWKSGKTDKTYDECFETMCQKYAKSKRDIQIYVIDHYYVESLQEAYNFNQRQLAKGLEGSIIKTLSHKWKDGTSKECLKLKIEAEIDLVVVDIEEASGKDVGCAGRIIAQSSCGKLITGVNCNGEQPHRRYIFENKNEYIGKVFTCIANDLVDNELKPNVMALFLARSDLFNEIRTDKNEADNLERIEQIFQAIKNGEMLYE